MQKDESQHGTLIPFPQIEPTRPRAPSQSPTGDCGPAHLRITTHPRWPTADTRQRLLPSFTTPMEDWDILAYNRKEWRDFTNLTAADFEDDHWHRYWRARQCRWLSDERLERRLYLRILEAPIHRGLPNDSRDKTPCDSEGNVAIDQQLRSYWSTARTNAFRR